MKLYKPDHREIQESAYTDYLPATLEDLRKAAAELGHVVVPREPTTAMRVVGGLECPDHEGDKCETASQVYKAMIEAEG